MTNAEFKNEFDRDVSIQVDFSNDQEIPPSCITTKMNKLNLNCTGSFLTS